MDFKQFLVSKGYELKEDTPMDDIMKFHSEFNDMKSEELKKALQEENSQVVKELQAEIKANNESLASQGLELKRLKDSEPKTVKTVVEEIKEFKSEISEIANGAKKSVVLKAPTTRASVTNNEQATDLTTIGQLATAKLNATNLFPIINVTGTNHNGVIRYYDWDAATTARAAAMVAEGAAFPESTAKWEKHSINIQKIGDTLPVTEEFLEDEAMFAGELGMFLRTNVDIKVNSQIVNGTGTGQELTGLVTSSPAFTAVASGIDDASIYDLIVKVHEDITAAAGNKYSPNFALMNIKDINKMKLKKDANNNYVMPPFVSRDGQNVSGMVIVEDNDVTANTMIIGDSRYGRRYVISGTELSTGTVGSQFAEDELTLKVRKRMALLVRNVDKTGFRKVTSISAALTTLAT